MKIQTKCYSSLKKHPPRNIQQCLTKRLGPGRVLRGGTEVSPGRPHPPDLCQASLHVGSPHGGWAGWGRPPTGHPWRLVTP